LYTILERPEDGTELCLELSDTIAKHLDVNINDIAEEGRVMEAIEDMF
jgi:hypothetical protein